MTSQEFTRLCRELYGYGWQTKAAVALEIDISTVRAYSQGTQRNGHLATIKRETADKLRGIYGNKNNKE
jgi:hypothetical protein